MEMGIAESGAQLRRMIKEDEAAQILGIKVGTLRRWRSARMGPPYVKMGFAVRYDTADLQAYMDANRTANAKENVG
jgi:predicted DNA-binding transcriptional regulator AlpA